MLQENLFLYGRKPLAFSILSIRSTPRVLGRGVQRKGGLCSFIPFPLAGLVGVCDGKGWHEVVGWGVGGSPEKPGC